MKPLVLILSPLIEAHRAQIAEHYDVLYAPHTSTVESQLAAVNPDVRVVLTNGPVGLHKEAIDAMPRLELICALGVGYERIAVSHARARGIVLASGAGCNSDCVADHAMALLLAAVRNIVEYNKVVQGGAWRRGLAWAPNVSGSRMGVLGLGDIGLKIAHRAQAFNIDVAYHSRHARSDVGYPYHETLESLARWCDFLVVATPGGTHTRHLVNEAVLNALGPHGYVVNISRGTVIDTEALARAVRTDRIAGAALDVYEGEPKSPPELLGLPNVIFTPHIAGTSPVAVQNTVDQFLRNVAGHFSGAGPFCPIPVGAVL